MDSDKEIYMRKMNMKSPTNLPSSRSRTRYDDNIKDEKENISFKAQEIDDDYAKSNTSPIILSNSQLDSSAHDCITYGKDRSQVADSIINDSKEKPLKSDMNNVSSQNMNYGGFGIGQEYMIMTQTFIQQLTMQLNAEMKKNKDYEYIVRAQSEKCTRVIESLRSHAEEEIAELNIRLEQVTNERDEFKAKLEIVLNDEKKNNMYRRNNKEDNMGGAQFDEITKKNSELEIELSKRDKNIFDLENLYTQLKSEATAQKEMNETLKKQYSELLKKEDELELDNQKLARRIHDDEVFIQKLSQENERLVSKLTTEKDDIEQIKKENQKLKQTLEFLYKEKIEIDAQVKTKEDTNNSLKECNEDSKTDSVVTTNIISKPNPQELIETNVPIKNMNNKISTTNDFLKWITIETIPSSTKVLKKQNDLSPNGRNVIVGMPSNKKYEENKGQIEILQNNLQFLLVEKQKLDKEYFIVCPKAEKSVAQRKRKVELESEIDLVDKDIQRTKMKLREFDAFN